MGFRSGQRTRRLHRLGAGGLSGDGFGACGSQSSGQLGDRSAGRKALACGDAQGPGGNLCVPAALGLAATLRPAQGVFVVAAVSVAQPVADCSRPAVGITLDAGASKEQDGKGEENKGPHPASPVDKDCE